MESEMDAEMRFHVETRAEDLVRGGMGREEAARKARLLGLLVPTELGGDGGRRNQA